MITSRIRQILPELKKTETGIAKYILKNPEQITRQNIQATAAACGSSASAVFRFCRHIGVKGYPELKIMLAEEISGKSNDKASFLLNQETNSIFDYTKQVSDHIMLLGSVLSEDALKEAASKIVKARKVLLVGVGASYLVARDLQMKLIRVGIFTSCMEDEDLQLIGASSLNKDDVCILISYSGRTALVKKCGEESKKKGATNIVITKYGATPIYRLGDINLDIPVGEGQYREGATLSRLSQLITVDCLYSAVIAKLSDSKVRITDSFSVVVSKEIK